MAANLAVNSKIGKEEVGQYVGQSIIFRRTEQLKLLYAVFWIPIRPL